MVYERNRFLNDQLSSNLLPQNWDGSQIQQEASSAINVSEEMAQVSQNNELSNNFAGMTLNTNYFPFDSSADQLQQQHHEGIANNLPIQRIPMPIIPLQPNSLSSQISFSSLNASPAEYSDARQTGGQNFCQRINGWGNETQPNQFVPYSSETGGFSNGQPRAVGSPRQPSMEPARFSSRNRTPVQELPLNESAARFEDRNLFGASNSEEINYAVSSPVTVQPVTGYQNARVNDPQPALHFENELPVPKLSAESSENLEQNHSQDASNPDRVNPVTNSGVRAQHSVGSRSNTANGSTALRHYSRGQNGTRKQQSYPVRRLLTWTLLPQFICKMHPLFSTRIYCLTHHFPICGVCASVMCGTHGSCELAPKKNVPSTLQISIIRQLDRIFKKLDLCMQRLGVRDIWKVCAKKNMPLLNVFFKDTPDLQKTDSIVFLFNNLNELLERVGIARDYMEFLKGKLTMCDELLHQEPKLYYGGELMPLTKSISEMRQLTLTGQGIREAICGSETKFYMQFFTAEKEHRCHVSVDQVVVTAVANGGQSFPVDLRNCKMVGTLEATYTCFIPGVITLKIQMGAEPVERNHTAVVKINRFKEMEVISYLGCDMFNKPWGICVSQNGNIFVADRCNHNIKVFREDFLFKRVISEYGHAEGQLCKPTGIAIDKNENLVVCDKDNHRIQVFTLDGKFLRSSEKNIDMQIIGFPWAVAVNSKNEYIVSHLKFKVTIMTSSFDYVTDLYIAPPGRNPEAPFNPRGICVDYSDQMYVTDFESGLVYRAAREHPYFEEFFASSSHHDVQVVPPSSRLQSIIMDTGSNFILADSKRYRIEFRSYSGALLGHVRTRGKPMAVAEMPGLQDHYVVVLDECKFSLAVIGPKSIGSLFESSNISNGIQALESCAEK